MPETTEATEYVSLDEAAAVAKVAPRTLRRRVASGTVPTFVDGRDHRRRLVRLGDVVKLTEPRPIDRRPGAEEVDPRPAA